MMWTIVFWVAGIWLFVALVALAYLAFSGNELDAFEMVLSVAWPFMLWMLAWFWFGERLRGWKMRQAREGRRR